MALRRNPRTGELEQVDQQAYKEGIQAALGNPMQAKPVQEPMGSEEAPVLDEEQARARAELLKAHLRNQAMGQAPQFEAPAEQNEMPVIDASDEEMGPDGVVRSKKSKFNRLKATLGRK